MRTKYVRTYVRILYLFTVAFFCYPCVVNCGYVLDVMFEMEICNSALELFKSAVCCVHSKY